MKSWRLRAIQHLLWRADALICGMPRPEAASGAYFDLWARLHAVHGKISELPPDLAASGQKHAPGADG